MNDLPGLTIVEEYEADLEEIFPSTSVGQEVYVRGVSVVLFELADTLQLYPIPRPEQGEPVALDWFELGEKVRELAREARGRETPAPAGTGE